MSRTMPLHARQKAPSRSFLTVSCVIAAAAFLPHASSRRVTTTCSSQVAPGDKSVGIDAYEDSTCENGGLGCFAGGACRYCKTADTPQADHFHPCPDSGGPPPPSPTKGPTKGPTNAPSTNLRGNDDPTPTPPTPPTPPTGPTPTPPAPPVDTGLCAPSTCRDNTSGECLHDRLLTCAPFNSDGASCPAEHTPCSKLLFFDDFTKFDLSTWKHEITMAGGGNWEFQLYRNNRTNSFVSDGSLHLEPSLTADWLPDLGRLSLHGMTEASQCTSAAFWGCERNDAPPISSARVTTVQSFAFKEGRLEVRARLPRGDWIWPAIWLLPKHEAYGGWPASGEIDVMEGRGNAPGYEGDLGVDHVSSALHWGPDWSQNRYDQTVGSVKLDGGKDFSQDYHVFGLVRHSTGLYTYVDDDSNRVLEVDWSDGRTFFEKGGWDGDHWTNPWEGSSSAAAPFDEEFYLILNLAVGGVSGFFPDGNDPKPWSNGSDRAQAEFWEKRNQWLPSWVDNDTGFKIDWVKVMEN